MTAPSSRLALALVAVTASGCAVQLGAAGGHAVALEPSKGGPEGRDVGRPSWASQLAASTVLGKSRGLLIGAEVEARTEQRIGARWTSGAWLGYAWLPRRERWATGLELHADAGTRFEQGALFAHGSYYLGSTGALVLWASERHDAYDADGSSWLLVRAVEIVAGGRFRCYDDAPPGAAFGARCDLAATLALRLRAVSDLLE